MPPRILVVDDDQDMREMVVAALESDGFRVTAVANAMDAFEEIDKRPPDLVVLDVQMPAISGMEVLDTLAQRPVRLPVIMLTSYGAEENRVRGLRLGADDYITKPFSPRELAARVHAVLRRSTTTATGTTIIAGRLRIERDTRQVTFDGEPMELTAKEFDLLAFLASNGGRVYTRRQLLRDVWDSSPEWQHETTVTEHVRRLRAKLGDDGERILQTVRGVGYRFERRA